MIPRVSVIIRTYNRADYLVEAIESVLAQTFRDLELIVVDDGSTDATRDVLLRYYGRLMPIFLRRTANPAATLNAGIQASRGELIAFLDDDDIWLPSKLERQVTALDNNSHVGFTYGNARLLYADGYLSEPALRPDQIIVGGSVLHTMVRNMCVHPSTLLFRRRYLDQLELPDESQPVAETFLFTLRLARIANAVCIPEPLVLIRQHSAQLNTERGLANYAAAIAALEELLRDETLRWSVRLEAYHSLARYHTHIAKQLFQSGESAAARHHAVRGLLHYPLHRPAWRWTLQTLLGKLG